MATDETNSIKEPLQGTPQETRKLGLKLGDNNSSSVSGNQSQLRKIAEKRLQVSVDELRDLHDNISLSWKNIDVFAPVKGAGKCSGKCYRKSKGEELPGKQLLSNGERWCQPYV